MARSDARSMSVWYHHFNMNTNIINYSNRQTDAVRDVT